MQQCKYPVGLSAKYCILKQNGVHITTSQKLEYVIDRIHEGRANKPMNVRLIYCVAASSSTCSIKNCRQKQGGYQSFCQN